MLRAPISRAIRLLICVLVLAGAISAPADQMVSSADALPVRALRNAASLYLREAASSPVRWQPWDEKTFKLAHSLHRPLLVDIGAAWCHACRLMDQTTYSDPVVIDLINRHFVPIRVDADQRPDIDAFYQRAARSRNVGGIPLTCLAAADGTPLYIEGFLPPKLAGREIGYGMIYSLKEIGAAYSKDAAFAKDAGERLPAHLPPGDLKGPAASIRDELRNHVANSFLRSYDETYGGFGKYSGQRFPNFPAIQFSLAHGFFGDERFDTMALQSLRKIARGGVYDRLGGGFFRFAVDHAWRVPHFEKTSQDQALALSAYADAYEATGDTQFAATARSILGYLNANLLDPRLHVFYAAQDSDTADRHDGNYYTWTADEVRRTLSPELARAALLYFGFEDQPGITGDGRVVLRGTLDAAELANRLRVSPDDAYRLIEKASQALLAARARRVAPRVEAIVMADRNALMASAYLRASTALDDPSLERIALDDLDFILARMRSPGGGFYHVWSERGPQVHGLVADQVYLMGALLEAYQASAKASYLEEARELGNLILARFADPSTGMLLDRSRSVGGTVLSKALPDPDVFYDGPMPAVQASASLAFATLSAITSKRSYAGAADKLINQAPPTVALRALPVLGTTGLALQREASHETVVAIVGRSDDPRTRALIDSARRTYRPFTVVISTDPSSTRAEALPSAARPYFAAAITQESPVAFVCAGQVCATPIHQPDKLALIIRSLGIKRGDPEGRERRAHMEYREARPDTVLGPHLL